MKKLISWLLTATLVMTTVFSVPITSSAATAVDCTGAICRVDTYDELKDAFESNGEDRTIILETSITCTDSPETDYMISKTGADTVVLDFQGNQLIFETTNTQTIFDISGNGNVYFLDSANKKTSGVFLDFGKNASVKNLAPSIVYVNMDTAKGFYSYGINYTIGHWDKTGSGTVDGSIDCANIRINQGDVTLSGGDIYNFYNIGNGIAGYQPRSFDVIIDGMRIYSGHSPIYVIGMDEISMSIFNADIQSYNGHVCVNDPSNVNRMLTSVLGEDYVNGESPSVTFGNASLNADTAKLTDVKSMMKCSIDLSGHTYQLEEVIFPTGHLYLYYETKGLEKIVPHNSSKAIVKATPEADGVIKETCLCGLDMATAIPKIADIKIQYTQTAYGGTPQSPYVYYVKDSTGKELVKDKDYTVSYKNNVNVGIAAVTITGIGEYYTGSIDQNYEITPATIKTAIVKGIENQTYTGKELTPEPVVTVDDKVLVKGTDYTVKYENNVNAGTATVRITGAGNYIGTIIKTFTITKTSTPIPDTPVPDTPEPGPEPEKIAISNATVKAIANQSYTGKAVTPKCIAVIDGKELVEGTDYTVAYKNNINAGTASIILTGQGVYSGEKTVTFTIKPKKITAMTLSSGKFVYNGKAKKPLVTVKAGKNVIASKISADKPSVDITYAKGRKNVGKYKVTVKGKGNYTGTLTKTFTINPKATTLTLTSKAKKTFTAKWTKRTVQVTGYEVMYAKNEQFTKGKKTVKVKSYKTNTKKITGLKSGQKYWAKVRTYKTVNGIKYYSTWSPVKTIKVK